MPHVDVSIYDTRIVTAPRDLDSSLFFGRASAREEAVVGAGRGVAGGIGVAGGGSVHAAIDNSRRPAVQQNSYPKCSYASG